MSGEKITIRKTASVGMSGVFDPLVRVVLRQSGGQIFDVLADVPDKPERLYRPKFKASLFAGASKRHGRA